MKRVTVNANQAVVADQIVSMEASTAALVTSGTEQPMEILEPSHAEAVPVTARMKFARTPWTSSCGAALHR